MPRAGVRAQEDGEETKRGPVLRCVFCGHGICDAAARVSVQGSHEHTFSNPAGIIYHIGCFASAPGCRLAGEPTGEFSWFAGYAWRYALCGGCSIHLGWVYRSGDGDRFFGLIVERLEEGEVQ